MTYFFSTGLARGPVTNMRYDNLYQYVYRPKMQKRIEFPWPLYTLINSQSLEDTQVGYISQEYTLDKYTLEKIHEKNKLWKNKLWGYTL